MSGKTPFHRSQGFKLLLGVVITLACLWWALGNLLWDPAARAQLVSAFQRADYSTLPAILGILAVFYWLKAVRWRLLLLPVGRFRPVRDLLGPILIGFGFNNLLPARIGEFVRCYVFKTEQQRPLTVAIGSVVLERVFDGLAIVFYLAIGLLFVEGLNPAVRQGAIAFSAAAGVIVVAALVYVIWTKPFVTLLERILKRLPLVPHGLVDRVCVILETGAQGLAALKDIRLILAIVGLSLGKWALNGALVLLSLKSFGLPHTIPVALVMLGAVAFGVAAPSTPGYIGVMQAIFKEVMRFFTQDTEAIIAASFYFQFTQWIPVSLAGLICFWRFYLRTGISLTQMEHVKEAVDEQAPAGESPAGNAS